MRRTRLIPLNRAARLLVVSLALLGALGLPTAAGNAEEAPTPTPPSDLERARAALAEQMELHPILAGTTVEIGYAHGCEAVAYYDQGRIVLSEDRRDSVERIIEHEVWHIIDWRDNGQLDWGENVPPR